MLCGFVSYIAIGKINESLPNKNNIRMLELLKHPEIVFSMIGPFCYCLVYGSLNPIMEFYLKEFELNTIQIGIVIGGYSIAYSIGCWTFSSLKPGIDYRILITIAYFVNCLAQFMAGPLAFDYISIVILGLCLIGLGLGFLVIYSLEYVQKFFEQKGFE